MPRKPAPPTEAAFGAAYYDRFYERAESRVHGAEEIGHLALGVVSMAAWLRIEVKSVLDVGAGPGLWRDWFRANRPEIAYRSTDVSPYACERYGHEQRDISTWKSRARFDLVVCQGVLQYLDDAACAAAIHHLGGFTRGLLYLEAVTEGDAKHTCDREKTDLSIHLRPRDWYRSRLEAHFVTLGAGLYASRRANHPFYELERA